MAAHPPTPANDPGLGLAMAIVCASPTPLLLLNGGCRVVAASVSFCDMFGLDPTAAVGSPIFALGAGEWDMPQLRSLFEATASGAAIIDSYEMDLRLPSGAVRYLVLKARKLEHEDQGRSRLLVAIADVTEARALATKDRELAQANALLIKEARHRIANSLQIIASVMMLNARRTSSEETRGQLREAHSRVMSLADLQQQLAVSMDEAVAIGPYLTRLCQTITASMIANPEALSITVAAPDACIDADVSVSLGLIVTELVINSLKHGFPEGARGSIDVTYAAHGPGWTLSVTDTGVGMPAAGTKTMAGLGTSIVRALARQLGARIEVANRRPGTQISVVHDEASAIGVSAASAPPRQAV